MSTKYFCDSCGKETGYDHNRPCVSRQLSVSIGGRAVGGSISLFNSDYMFVLCAECEAKDKRDMISRLTEEALRRL